MTRAAGIMFRAGDRVLLLQRGDRCDHPGTWAFPGGKVEPGEGAEEAARREVLEEVLFDASACPLTVADSTDAFTTYTAEVPEPFPVTLNDEHTAGRWFELGDLPRPLHPGTAALLARQCAAAMDKSARAYDGNGWFEVKNNPLSKVGVFPYSGKQLGLTDPADRDRLFNVLRPPEELDNPECIESFKLIPWVDNHTMLGPTAQALKMPNAAPAEAKGVQGVIGQDVYFKDGVLYGNLKVFSESLARLIEEGKRELSAGYRCVYDRAAGVFGGIAYDFVQRKIRGNHLALVDSGRMGPDVAVMDHLSFTFDAKEIEMSDKDPKAAKDAESAGGAGEMTIAEAIRLMGEIMPQIAKLQEFMATAGKPAATVTETVTDEDDPAEAAAVVEADDKAPEALATMDAALKATRAEVAALRSLTDPRAMLKAISQRDALARSLSPFVGAFDHAEMTADDVAAYGCEKLGIKVNKGAAHAALQGFLHGRTAATPAAAAMDTAAPARSSAISKFLGA